MNGRRIFAAVTVGHLGIDIFNSMGPVLLAFLQAPLGLSAAQIGLAVGLFQVLAGTTQPAFGWLVDRVGSRFLGPFSVAFNFACMGLAVAAAAATGRFVLFLIPFALAAVASGAFHPLGVMHSSTVNLARSATFTAIFFFCGQLGLTTGPVLAGLALDRAGLNGIYWLLLFAAPVPLFMAFAMGPRRVHPVPAASQPNENQAGDATVSAGRQVRGGVIALLGLVFASRSWAMFGTMAFLPLLLSQRGYSSVAQGSASALFLLGGALTAVLAGAWAERWGRRPIVFLTTLLGALLLGVLPGSGGWIFAVVLPCGALLGASHSILIVMAQELLPWRRGLASGTALGFLFATGGIATWCIGELADRFELAAVLQAGAVVGLVSAFASLLLPKQEPTRLAAAPAVTAVLVASVVGLTVLSPSPASAGLNGEINGQVRDAATDVPLPGAEIRITGDQLHSAQTVRAGRGGSFRAPGLPPGDYYVEATVDGYATSVVENLILVAGGVLRVDFHMRAGSASALDLVSSPLLDVVTGSDGNVLAGDDLRQLPGAVAALNLDLASGLDALGPDVAVNGWPPGFANYRVDGQESALREPGSTAIDPRWVDQVRVWTMELAATMAGPHIDLITRSGGTDWQVNGGWSTVEPLDNGERLALRLFGAGESPAGGRDRRRIEGDEATVFAGGPLRDKRARAFGGYSRSRARGTESLFGAVAPMTWDETIEQSIGKLDWWAGSASNLTLKHHAGSGDLDGRRPALEVLPSVDGTENDRSRRQTTSLNVEWGVTDRLWLRVFGGRSDLIEDGEPWQDAGLYFAAPASGRLAGWYEAAPAGRVRRAAERRNWAVEPSFFLFDHTLEIGIQDSRSSLELLRSQGSGRLLRFAGGTPEAWSGGALGAAGLRQEKRALYAQDAWRVGGAFKRHLTLHVGLRAEEEKAGPLDLEFADRTEPRLAFVWDVAGRGRWKAYGGAAWWHVDVFRPRAGRSDLDAVAALEATGGYSGAPLDFARAAVDPDLRPARVREIQLGTGYQFLPDVVISARVSRRQLRNGIRLMPLLDAGEVVPTLLTPGRGAGGELPQLEQDWWGAELNAHVGFSPSWRIHFSYVLSRLTGNHEAGGLGMEAGTLPGAHPVLAALDLCSSPVPCDVFDVTSGSRRLSLDREHQLSGWLVLSPGERWLMALVYRFRTGAAYVPRALTVRVDEASRILSTGLTPLPSGPDGLVKSADLKRADLSLTYRVPLRSEDRRLSLFAEALNVFDQDAANQLWPLAYLDPVFVGPGRTDLLAAAAAQGARPDPRESLPAAFQTSRRVRAGLRLQF
ncbi:MAG: MFS transporter [Holophagales bacterium]|nr:MFS transporter [Holophagales bacterium]MYC09182.1 MFS transporter [Holophagales bacterium]